MAQALMKVTKTLEVDAPGLGAKIKAAREADRRPLLSICRELNMSSQNWYRIEKEEQTLPIETLRQIEQVLGVDFGVSFEDNAKADT